MSPAARSVTELALAVVAVAAGRRAWPLVEFGVHPPAVVTPRLFKAATLCVLSVGMVVGMWIGGP